jgi:signal transduction histidine kinase/DNA-binding NarL/FixJ family response regulator
MSFINLVTNNLPLRYRITFSIIFIEALLMGTMLLYLVGYIDHVSETQVKKGDDIVIELLAELTKNALFIEEYDDLENQLLKLKKNPRVIRAFIADFEGLVLASSRISDVGKNQSIVLPNKEKPQWRIEPLSSEAGDMGVLAIQFSTEILQKIREDAIQVGLLIALIGIIVIGLLGPLVGHLLTRKLEQLITTVFDFTKSRFTSEIDVSPYLLSNDRISKLGIEFSNMSKVLKAQLNQQQQFVTSLEDKVEQRTKALSQAQLASESANQMKTTFLTNMSHEIRTPLNAVIGYAQLLENKPLSPDNLVMVKKINTAGNHLLTLINDVLDLSKIEAGKMELHIKTFSLTQLLEEVDNIFRLRCEKKGLLFELKNRCNRSPLVEGDEVKVRQILINLLGNATKFTSSGSVTLVTEYENGLLQFQVKDTGHGITEKEQQALFESFSQGTAGALHGGTGLGLSIVKRQLDLMHGSIGVQSDPRGTIFTMTIPAVQVGEECRVEEVDTISQKIIGVKYKKLNILIVDDVECNRDILKQLLFIENVSSMEVENGTEAIETCQKHHFDLILMDLRMPGMQGDEALSIIKKDNPEIRSIAISATTMVEGSAVIKPNLFNEYIVKPFKHDELFEKIRVIFDLEYIYEADSVFVSQAEQTLFLSSDARSNIIESLSCGDWDALEALIGEQRDKHPILMEQLQQTMQSFNADAAVALLKENSAC